MSAIGKLVPSHPGPGAPGDFRTPAAPICEPSSRALTRAQVLQCPDGRASWRPLVQQPRASVRQALEAGPKNFRELMEAMGSRDGRDVLIELDAVRKDVGLDRTPDGRYRLATQ